MRDLQEHLAEFQRIFGSLPAATGFAPGRVTVIGAHTDYNDGCVISAALPLGVFISITPCSGSTIRVHSQQQTRAVELPLGELAKHPEDSWTNYVVGAMSEFASQDRGWNAYISSDLPMQQGLASSAALTAATAMAATELTERTSAQDLAMRCRKVEYEATGVRCGILDYYTAFFAASGSLLHLDCKVLEHRLVPFPNDLCLAICDCGIGRELKSTHYNNRREECRRAAAFLGRQSLRDVRPEDVEQLKTLYPLEWKRALHVVSENKRVSTFSSSLSSANYAAAGAQMFDSHSSCRNLYECTIPELDRLVDVASTGQGCIGARLTGAGWGGFTVNLIRGIHVEEFRRHIDKNFKPGGLIQTQFFRPGDRGFSVRH